MADKPESNMAALDQNSSLILQRQLIDQYLQTAKEENWIKAANLHKVGQIDNELHDYDRGTEDNGKSVEILHKLKGSSKDQQKIDRLLSDSDLEYGISLAMPHTVDLFESGKELLDRHAKAVDVFDEGLRLARHCYADRPSYLADFLLKKGFASMSRAHDLEHPLTTEAKDYAQFLQDANGAFKEGLQFNVKDKSATAKVSKALLLNGLGCSEMDLAKGDDAGYHRADNAFGQAYEVWNSIAPSSKTDSFRLSLLQNYHVIVTLRNSPHEDLSQEIENKIMEVTARLEKSGH